MKLKVLMLLTLVLVSACASQTAYRPASGAGFGYQETEISENRYRVQFKMNGENRNKAMDYALLRAAEMTLLEGYDWFEVVGRETVVNRDEDPQMHTSFSNSQVVTRDCGLLGCTTTTTPVRSQSTGFHTGGRGTTESLLEIRLGKGVRPSTGDNFDAVEVKENLGA